MPVVCEMQLESGLRIRASSFAARPTNYDQTEINFNSLLTDEQANV